MDIKVKNRTEHTSKAISFFCSISRYFSYALSPQRVGVLLFIVTIGYSAYYLGMALGQPILESFGFRQTQTAITAYYFIKDGLRLAYWTPVVGQGWSVPFEFPIYQAIVATAVKLTHAPLEAAGRIVSWLFMLLCCLPLYVTLRQIGASVATRFLCLALVMSSPEYVFWSSTFMIETTALFFTLFFVFYATRIYQKQGSFYDYGAAALFLALGLLQKSTTALPVAAVFSLAIALRNFRPAVMRREWRHVTAAAAVVLFGVALLFAWTAYSDFIKSQNPIGDWLTSSRLTEWNFGTVEQRLSSKLWIEVLYDRVFRGSVFGAAGLAAIILGLIVARDAARRRAIALAALTGLLQFLVFTNLHIVHSYYQVSATVFFLIAVGLSVGTMAEELFPDRNILFAMLATWLVVANFVSFEDLYGPTRRMTISPENNSTLKIAEFIQANTAEDDTVMWYGFDWSSEVAFYSQRKSLTVPAWPWTNFEIDAIEHRERFLDRDPAAIVVCRSPNTEHVLSAVRAKYPAAAVETVSNCPIFLIGAPTSVRDQRQ